MQNYNEENKDIIILKRKEYNEKNKEKNKIQKQQYWAKLGKKERRGRNQKWLSKNRKWSRDYQRKWRKERKEKDPSFLIQDRIRKRLWGLINRGLAKKLVKTESLLGCSWEEFKTYIESKFSKNMSWEYYHQRLLHLDHIKPCCAFDLTSEEEQKKCFHYTNMEPRWATTEIAIKYGGENKTYIGNLNKTHEDIKQSIRNKS